MKPKDIDSHVRQHSIQLMIDKLKSKTITPMFPILNPWNNVEKSRFIESILIHLALPRMYVNGANNNDWKIIDGHNRIAAINDFAVAKTLKLTGLEFLHEIEGMSWNDIAPWRQRHFVEEEQCIILLSAGVPANVLQSLCNRFNPKYFPKIKEN